VMVSEGVRTLGERYDGLTGVLVVGDGKEWLFLPHIEPKSR